MKSESTQSTMAAGLIAAALIVGALIMTRGGDTPQAVAGVKEFDIVMQNNEYRPSKITVNLGDKVAINITNKDKVAHGVALPVFGASVPQGHVFPGQTARMEFVANQKTTTDAALCGGPKPEDKSDGHGEELVVEVI